MTAQASGKPVSIRSYHSPVGLMFLFATDEGICGLTFDESLTKKTLDFGDLTKNASDAADAHLKNASNQLTEYFASKREEFDVPLDIQTGTPFQRRVWEALRTIPHGQTCSYGELAEKIGEPNAARAVGGANNQNPIAIIIPCHRVIGASGDLVGFGAGLDKKKHLLDLESRGVEAVLLDQLKWLDR